MSTAVKETTNHKNATCYKCNKKGHIASICKAVNYTEERGKNDILSVNSMNTGKSKITVTIDIWGKPTVMEVDTGSSVSLMSYKDFVRHFWKIKLETPKSVLKTYSNETIEQVGIKTVRVNYKGQKKDLRLHVVKGNGSTLLGRDWLSEIQLDWNNILHVKTVSTNDKLKNVLSKYGSIFSDGIGKVKGVKASLTLKKDAKPKFLKARPVPYALKPKIEQELENLERQGIISKANTSDWATPIVPVVKPNGQIRI